MPYVDGSGKAKVSVVDLGTKTMKIGIELGGHVKEGYVW